MWRKILVLLVGVMAGDVSNVSSQTTCLITMGIMLGGQIWLSVEL